MKVHSKICLLSCLEQLSLKNNKKFQYGYLAYWPFYYKEGGGMALGSGIEYNNFQRFNEICSRYIGYRTLFHEGRKEKVPALLREALQEGKAVLVNLDAFFCPWNPVYGRQHIPRFLIIQEWDRQRECYICMDAFCSWEELYPLPEEHLLQGYQNMRIMEESAAHDMTVREVCQYLTAGCDHGRIGNSYNSFVSDISRIGDMKHMFDGREAENCTIIRKVWEIEESRRGIADLLQQAGQCRESGISDGLSDSFHEQEDKWGAINMLFMKMYLSKRLKQVYIDKIMDMLTELKEQELACFDRLRRLYVSMDMA